MLERVTRILDAVEARPLSASTLAEQTALSISTAHRLANEMAGFGFLSRDDDGRFSLGTRFKVAPLELAARPTLIDLRYRTSETAQLWVRRGNVRLCLVTEDSHNELRATLPIGSRIELPTGSSGRILADGVGVREELARNGWVESVSERTPGLTSVSAPVIVHGNLLAAVCLAAPVTRSGEHPGAKYGIDVVHAAQEIMQTVENSLS
ncbi:IclR family transcriptional regulator [Arthrobacter pigmenti]